ncbi:MAG: sensor histidine kinase [Bacilli bacterium]|nr:sensor histidine kinase [Bacilli bacterium]
MPYKLNIFSKIVILIILLLVPILFLYSVSNRISKNVVQEQIQRSNLNQLSFFLHQLDTNMDQLSVFPVILSFDPYIREFIDRRLSPQYDVLKEQARITEKFSLQSVSSGWANDLTLILPKEKRIISSSIFQTPNEAFSSGNIRSNWTFKEDPRGGKIHSYFIREIAEPATAKTAVEANAIFQVGFSGQNIVDMLDLYKDAKHSDPFLFHGYDPPILNSTSSNPFVDQLIPILRNEALKDSGQEILEIEKHQFLVSFVKSTQMGWYLVDYVPLQNILAPITKSSNFFYISVGMLLILSVMASFLLYKNVQIPIRKLLGSVQRIKRGDFSARIEYHAKNEFDFLFLRFNEMAEQIQLLIENVYAEKIRSREATLKQLQSQINPHFLYNSLFFIINSAMLEDKESVVEMAQNLAEYYRYTTRVENQWVSLREELAMVSHYMVIQNLRMNRLAFEISVPEEMMELRLPRLILQPLVENAIIHGIERKVHGGLIQITGEQDNNLNKIIIEDNGIGMTAEEIQELQNKVSMPMSEEIGCGTWNVHHRLYYQFGEGSGLTFSRASSGGTKVVISWNRNAQESIHTLYKEG